MYTNTFPDVLERRITRRGDTIKKDDWVNRKIEPLRWCADGTAYQHHVTLICLGSMSHIVEGWIPLSTLCSAMYGANASYGKIGDGGTPQPA